MASLSQLKANRANAQRCTGPKTEQGKANSSRNSTKHGLTSTRVLIEGDDPAELEALRRKHLDEYEPQTVTEEALTEQIADAYWRLLRAQWIEAQCIERAAAKPEIDVDSIAKIARYVSGVARDWTRHIDQLRRIQTERKKEAAHQALEAAKLEAGRIPPALMEEPADLEPSTTSQSIGFVSPDPPTLPGEVPAETA